MNEIGKNLKNSGKKFISKIIIQKDSIAQAEIENGDEIVIQDNSPGFGEATSETDKKIDEIIVHKHKEDTNT